MPTTPHRVLFVCTANMFRSPTAELVLRHLSKGKIEIKSAGALVAENRWVGRSMMPGPEKALTDALGAIGQKDHKAQQVTAVLLSWADYVVCMEGSHVRKCYALGAPLVAAGKMPKIILLPNEFGESELVPDLSATSNAANAAFFSKSFVRITNGCKALLNSVLKVSE